MMRSRANYDSTGSGLHVFFVLTTCIHSALSQCSGTTLVFTATDTYQVFTSLNYPFGYSNDQYCTWRIEADNITDAIRMEVTDASIEFHADCVYDYGQVFDGYNRSASSMGKFCGTENPSFVSTGNYMTVIFTSDYSLASKGFKARYKSGPRSSLLDKDEDTNPVNMLVILGASVGSVVLIIVVITLVYTYIQAKKAKEMRRHPHMHRGMGLARVEPFGYGGGWSYLDGPAPPAYGEIYSSPMSPPPQYSEIDPNPSPRAPLQGRREFMADNNVGENGITHNTDSSSTEQRTDTSANTHFIMTRNINGVVTQRSNCTNSRTRTTGTGGVLVNSSIHTLNPSSLQTASNGTMPSGNCTAINIPGQTFAVAPRSTESLQRQQSISNNSNSGQIENTAPSARQTLPANTIVSAQNEILTSPSQNVSTHGVVSPL